MTAGDNRPIVSLIYCFGEVIAIARRLYLSEGAVRNYVTGVLSKLDVADRTQAAILALQYGVVGPEDG